MKKFRIDIEDMPETIEAKDIIEARDIARNHITIIDMNKCNNCDNDLMSVCDNCNTELTENPSCDCCGVLLTDNICPNCKSMCVDCEDKAIGNENEIWKKEVEETS
jgi:hypothetical protein